MFKSAALKTFFKNLFALPGFLDEEQVVTGRMLTVFFWMIMFFVTVILLVVIVTEPEQAVRPMISILAVNSIFIIMIALIKRGKIRLANYLSIGIFWLIITVFASTAGGMQAPSYTGYIVVTFLAGISLGGRAIFVMAAISGASSLGMAYLDSIGLLPVSEFQFTPYTYWLVEFSFVLILAFMQYYASLLAKISLKQARIEMEERIRTEDALRSSEERFHTLVEQAPVAIMISRGVQPVYANQTLIDMIGYRDQAQVLSRSIIDYFMLAYPGLSRENLAQRIIDLPSPGEIEINLEHANGTIFPAHIFIKTIYLPEGQSNVSFIIDITERKQAEAQITASIRQLHALSAHLQTIREEERANIAREIHDELGQALTGIKMDLFWLKNRIEKQEGTPQSEPIIHKLSSLVMETDLLIDDVRRISTDLRPSILDTLGLIAAMEWLTRDFQARSGITCQFQTPLRSLTVPQEFSTAVFRICQESLTNVARHAQARNVTVQIKLQKGNLILSVDDDGKGITDEEIRRPGSLGILGMQERAFSFNGRVDFEKSTRGGTCVIARFQNPPVTIDNR